MSDEYITELNRQITTSDMLPDQFGHQKVMVKILFDQKVQVC